MCAAIALSEGSYRDLANVRAVELKRFVRAENSKIWVCFDDRSVLHRELRSPHRVSVAPSHPTRTNLADLMRVYQDGKAQQY